MVHQRKLSIAHTRTRPPVPHLCGGRNSATSTHDGQIGRYALALSVTEGEILHLNARSVTRTMGMVRSGG